MSINNNIIIIIKRNTYGFKMTGILRRANVTRVIHSAIKKRKPEIIITTGLCIL